MKSVNSSTLFLAVFIILSAGSAQAQQSCNILVQQAPHPGEDSLLKANLLTLQKHETAGKTSEEVAKMNSESLRVLEEAPPITSVSGRLTSLSLPMISQVVASITKNRVIMASKRGVYDQPDTQIAYCFGRAAYVHFALLKMGVDKNAIRKIWAVGPMEGQITWQFHVSTIVRGDDGKWYAVDNLFGGDPVPLEKWVSTWRGLNKDGKLRIYVTDAQKFSVELGTYDRVQLGLDLTRDKDWYKGFFKDLMEWFQTGSLESVGLSRLIPSKKIERSTPAVASPAVRTETTANPETPAPRNGTQTAAESTAPAASESRTQTIEVVRPADTTTRRSMDRTAFQTLETNLITAHRAYANAPTGSAAEANARTQLKQASTALLRMLESTSSMTYKDLETLAHHAQRQYSLAPTGSTLESTYRQLQQGYAQAIPSAFREAATQGRWNSQQLVQAAHEFGQSYQRAATGSTLESAYRSTHNVATDLALAAYQKENLNWSSGQYLQEAAIQNTNYQRSATGSSLEALHRQMAKLSFDRSLSAFGREIVAMDYQTLLALAHRHSESYQRSARGSTAEATYLSMVNSAFSAAREKYAAAASGKSFEQLRADAALFLQNYQTSATGSVTESTYRTLLKTANDVALKRFTLDMKNMPESQRASYKQIFNDAYQRSASGSQQEAFYRSLLQILK